jgi:hypothetical protein
VDAGSREENASKQQSRAPLRFDRNGKGSSSTRRAAAALAAGAMNNYATVLCHDRAARDVNISISRWFAIERAPMLAR